MVCRTVYGNMHLKRSPGIIRKSRVLYPGPGFLSSATWPSITCKGKGSDKGPSQVRITELSLHGKTR